MLLITGATGKLGKSTIDFLLKKLQPAQLAVLARDPKKAEGITSRGVSLRQGDYGDFASLQAAFKGIDELLFISSPVTGKERDRQHGNVVKSSERSRNQTYLLYQHCSALCYCHFWCHARAFCY